jgi:hypothetical protein
MDVKHGKPDNGGKRFTGSEGDIETYFSRVETPISINDTYRRHDGLRWYNRDAITNYPTNTCFQVISNTGFMCGQLQ